jgi:quercetin dioxygenase-like cupin family protein
VSGQPAKVLPDWRDTVSYSAAGPGVTLLHESDELKVVLVGLEPGQALPPHPGPAASFQVLSGEGVIAVDDEQVSVTAGAIVVVPSGALRSVRAVSRLAFLGCLGDPSAEHGPH